MGADGKGGVGQTGPGVPDGPPTGLTYRASGVDLDAADETVARMRTLTAATARPGVMGGIGGFGGLFDLAEAGYKRPVLVSGTDSVGTKLKIAFMTGRHDTVGQDCVAMCVNDILTHGAEPLFFLDYIGIARYDPEVVVDLVRGVADGCRVAGCTLIGGETAQLPGLYQPGEYDLAGFAVGAVEKDAVLDGSAVRAGDEIIGLASSGLHSNGFSLARRALLEGPDGPVTDLSFCPPELGGDRSLADELLEPTRIYVQPVLAALRVGLTVHGMAHITGGGLNNNSFRILGDGLRACLDAGAWPVPPIYRLLAGPGGVGAAEMLRTFNCGLGYLVYVPEAEAGRAVELFAKHGVQAYRAGRVERSEGGERGFCLSGDAASLFR